MITSGDNPRVKQARALLDQRGREAQNHCLIEGARLLEEALRAGITPALVFFTDQARTNARAEAVLLRAGQAGSSLLALSPKAFGTLSDTVSSQGIIAEIAIPHPDLPVERDFVLVLDGIRDPGNVGTILRGAEAAGAPVVVLAPGCADAWSPKVVRSGMGAHFRLRLAPVESWEAVAALVQGLPVWVADAQGATPYDEVDWIGSCALIIGSEAQGASAEARSLATGRVSIPIEGQAESLNAAMAASILLFERARQKRRTREAPAGV